jgi:hypothetical protein
MNGEELPNNLHRLLKLIMVTRNMDLVAANEFLSSLPIVVRCSDSIRRSVSLQAALLTAVNCANRCYLGGVTVVMPEAVESLLPAHQAKFLNELAEIYGAKLAAEVPPGQRVLTISDAREDIDALRVVCDGWRAGLLPPGAEWNPSEKVDHALGGVFAAGLGVARCFMADCSLAIEALDTPFGLSLWRPDLDWRDASASGPPLQMLPEKVWLLGLGHLGQAYGWTASFLPFLDRSQFRLYLQDYDTIVRGNLSAGLLSPPNSVGRLKTRVAAEWLEARGFSTHLIEKKYKLPFERIDDEPRIAMCGFDNPEGRMILEKTGFDLVFECGLGGDVYTFDRILTHTFPQAAQRAEDIWSQPRLMPEFNLAPAQFGFNNPEECGVITDTVMGISVSTAFVGACSSALLWAEILRGIHGGVCLESASLRLRSNHRPRVTNGQESLQRKLAANGGLPVAR